MKINTTNMLYPHSLIWLIENHYPIAGAVAVLFPLFILWYFFDVLSNVFDWACIAFFLRLPLWAIQKEREHKDNEKRFGKAYHHNSFFFIRKP